MKIRDFANERLARRSIGYFTEDRCAAGASRGRQARRALVKRFVGEQGECESFLGMFGNAKARGRQDLNAGKSGRKLGEDQRIVGTAAGNDELVNSCFGQNETV